MNNNIYQFRVWDVKLNQYVPSEYLDRNFGLDYNGILRCLISSRQDDPFIIEQYTGCNDRNGVKIYMGDILKIGDKTAYVDFLAGMYFFCFDGQTDQEIGYTLISDMSIIGNINENLELLAKN